MLIACAVHELRHGVHHAYLSRSLLLRTVLSLHGFDGLEAGSALALDAGDAIEVVGVDPRGPHGADQQEAVHSQISRESIQARDIVLPTPARGIRRLREANRVRKSIDPAGPDQ